MSSSAASKIKRQLKRKKEHKAYLTNRNQIKMLELKQEILSQMSVHERTILAYQQFLNIIPDTHRKIFETLDSFKLLEEQFTSMRTILDELKEILDTSDDIKAYEQFFKIRFTELNYRRTQFTTNLVESSNSLDVELKKQTPVSTVESSEGFLPDTGELIEDVSDDKPFVVQEEYNLKLDEKILPIVPSLQNSIMEVSNPIAPNMS